jgi:hypothetical protein
MCCLWVALKIAANSFSPTNIYDFFISDLFFWVFQQRCRGESFVFDFLWDCSKPMVQREVKFFGHYEGLSKRLQKKPRRKHLRGCYIYGAQNRTRTCTYLRTLVPETSASTNFAIWANTLKIFVLKGLCPGQDSNLHELTLTTPSK